MTGHDPNIDANTDIERIFQDIEIDSLKSDMKFLKWFSPIIILYNVLTLLSAFYGSNSTIGQIIFASLFHGAIILVGIYCIIRYFKLKSRLQGLLFKRIMQ